MFAAFFVFFFQTAKVYHHWEYFQTNAKPFGYHHVVTREGSKPFGKSCDTNLLA